MSDWRTDPTTRTCKRCGTSFVGAYNSTSCQSCRKAVKGEASARFREQNPDYWQRWQAANRRSREARLRDTYGLTLADWEALADAQDRRCAICGKADGWIANAGNLVVDHCHASGKVRGLLCPPCNRGLGQFEDDPDNLMAAADYLAGHKAAQ